MSNVTNNRINVAVTAADLDKLAQALQAIREILDNYTVALTAEERIHLLGMEEENLVFAQDTVKLANQLLDTLSPETQVIVANLAADLMLWNIFDGLLRVQLEGIIQRVEDTRRLTAHESYGGALALYKIFQAMASIGIEGFQAPLNVLEPRFASQGGGKPADTNP